MYTDKVLILTFALLCRTTLSALICERQNKIEDFSEGVKNAKYVKQVDNFTVYILKDHVPLSLPTANDPLPEHIDWRDLGMISPVKNQMQCGACWAFSSVAAIESHVAIHKKTKVILSEQFLIDCFHYGKKDAPKCNNYPLLKTYSDIVADFGGVLDKNDYRPYSGSAKECTYVKPPPTPIPIIGYIRVANEDAMVAAIAHNGPLSAAINSKSMAKYKGNYIDEPTDEQCSPKPEHMNHAVLIVGYNVYVQNNKEVKYWIIKNSWGEKWGDKGYYYLVRGRNACGIANDVSFPVLPMPTL